MGTRIESEGLELKAELAEYRKTVPRGPFPQALRERGGRFARQQRRQGVSVKRIAASLGLSPATVQEWAAGGTTARADAPLQLIPVVVEDSKQATAGEPGDGLSALQVRFPNGIVLQVREMSAALIAEVVQGLARNS